MVIDVQATSRQFIGKMDAFLLLLAARNGIQFREEEWKWSPTIEIAETVQRKASKAIDIAMLTVKGEINAAAAKTNHHR